MTQNTVCVVIPHFNRAELLRQTLDSVRSQLLPEWQVIVVDDQSDAANWQMIQHFEDARIRVIRRKDGVKGPSRCRNLGWQAAEAELILFLDSDDLLGDWCLQQRLQLVLQHPAADAWVFPVMLFRQRPGDLRTLWNRMEGGSELQRFLMSDPPWHTSSTLWRRSTLQQLGGFNEKVMYGDDADLHMRAILGGVRFQCQPQALPDVFIRRADQQRITGNVSAALLDSRTVRLTEGTRAVRGAAAAAGSDCDLWQGQYFRECEFLLFNVQNSWGRIQGVLRQWRVEWPQLSVSRAVCLAYLVIAYICRTHAYLMLRVSRRLTMRLLPTGYFPVAGGFEQAEADAECWLRLQQRLDASYPAPADGRT